MKNRPNLLLFMPDTLRADAVLGPTETRAKTPHMDGLAADGVTFDNCFAQCPWCSPSRCSMFTGLYPHVRGHRTLTTLLKPEHRGLFRELKDAGYRNAVFGHNDLVAQESIPLSFDDVTPRVLPDPPEAYSPERHPSGSRWERTFYWGRRNGEDSHDRDWSIVQSALMFLDEPQDQPFCLYLPLIFPHPPYEVEEPFFSMHDISSIPEPIPTELDGKRQFMSVMRSAYGLDGLDTDDLKEIKRVYYGMTSRIDHQLGLLIEKLRERGLYDDTIVVVFSDHGDYTGDYGMVEKFPAGFEDCLLNVPLIIRGPGIDSGAASSALCQMNDLYPTLLEVAGVESQTPHFGRTLSPALRGNITQHRDAVFAEGGLHPWEQKQGNVTLPEDSPYLPGAEAARDNPEMNHRAMMIRTEDWKYVYCPNEHDELYDLASDPNETINLSDDPEHGEVAAEMRERLLRWMLETSDVLPTRFDPREWDEAD